MGLLILLFSTAAMCAGAEWDALKVTYGEPGYYDLPLTAGQATAQRKWQKIGEDKSIHVDVYSQPDDPHLMMLYDGNGNVAGLRMVVLKEIMDKKAKEGGHHFDVDYDNNPVFDKGNVFGKELYYTTVLLQNPITLAAGGRKTVDMANDDIAEGVFFKNNGKWTEVARDECKHDKDIFYEANCWAGMGAHYPFRNANEEDCTKRQSLKQSLYNRGRLIGFVFAGYGSYAKNPNTQNYYEDLPFEVTKAIMPNAPACMGEYAKKFGVLNMHVYLVKKASTIDCPTPKWSTKC